MENRYYWSSDLYPLFLDGISSCTFSSCTDEELQAQLDGLARRALARFKFPKVDLSYEYDNEPDEEGVPRGYYWVNEPTMREILVILAWMKFYWVEYQLSKERLYKDTYADKNITAWSPANLIKSIETAYNALRTDARKVEEDYSRINKDGRPAVGDINV